jgi:hypothetical protein
MPAARRSAILGSRLCYPIVSLSVGGGEFLALLRREGDRQLWRLGSPREQILWVLWLGRLRRWGSWSSLVRDVGERGGQVRLGRLLGLLCRARFDGKARGERARAS